jgi:hypothetical protein
LPTEDFYRRVIHILYRGYEILGMAFAVPEAGFWGSRPSDSNLETASASLFSSTLPGTPLTAPDAELCLRHPENKNIMRHKENIKIDLFFMRVPLKKFFKKLRRTF